MATIPEECVGCVSACNFYEMQKKFPCSLCTRIDSERRDYYTPTDGNVKKKSAKEMTDECSQRIVKRRREMK